MGETTWAYYERLHREACIREWQLKQQLESCQSQLKDAVEVIGYYSVEACNEDWCERYLPEHDKDVIDYLSGKRARDFIAKYRRENE